MPAFDYTAEVAHLYDEYCVYSEDVSFFRDRLAAVTGQVLELMAGTGRISLPLARAGSHVACVDSSYPMLAVLRRRLANAGVTAPVLCADVTRLPFTAASFDHAILPFNGLSELPTAVEREAMFFAVSRCLRRTGGFTCTFHNPVVRLRNVDDTWHVLGEVPRPHGGTLRLSLRARYDPDRRLVTGHQRIELIASGYETPTRELILALQFSLPPFEEVVGIADRAGFRLVSLYGDYGQVPYRPLDSPCIVAEFVKAD